MPEHSHMKRLDQYASSLLLYRCYSFLVANSFPNRLQEWCTPRIKSLMGYEFLKQTFAYDPDKRLTAREALRHRWFQEEPVPTAK